LRWEVTNARNRPGSRCPKAMTDLLENSHKNRTVGKKFLDNWIFLAVAADLSI